jgi:hypothetical protein
MKKKDRQFLDKKNELSTRRKNHPLEIIPGKKFSDFVFEFILIFLAITGGFFANNLRENIIDRNKEKEYIVSLIHDVEQDTTSVQENLRNKTLQLKGIGRLLNYMDSINIKKDNIRFYTLFFKYMGSYEIFTTTDITISQLTNSGGMRLIRDKSVLDSIVRYYSTIHSNDKQLEFNITKFNEIGDLEIRYFDINEINRKKGDVPLPEPVIMRELYNRIVIIQSVNVQDTVWLKQVYTKGNSLIGFLKKGYHLENKVMDGD